MSASMMTITMATATNVPATLPGLVRNPPLLVFGTCVTMVWKAGGGAVGVMVMVLTCPVTVSTEITGVGDHDELGDVEDEDELELAAGV